MRLRSLGNPWAPLPLLLPWRLGLQGCCCA